ncbi:putative tyrosine phosphatase [Leptomonas pyrrhocoris]|uniref:Putative tyrosine phosphatase n=1 Tax=Leptomonas pyrrhocoris TaxID=157538 RepID=A0A0N0DTS4_LEPPY|nr:putative tyrosine phosphatase [Leptomonas pyrrhocoris]XP_015655971.1 putative tyrosine phosphatase [Leptomonas pyrrhocoris]KPA77531.1 putative tyrosine phosphatase [Leptomonas pyrrhocoris]KPA77532.1 putative tyrosine phosphatase [Leptomonas pyrrhocoris]|eukprot:XP_015655970.1 putative tyrosine phosphatase [Leptomonas pyrrhocoris]
MEHSSQRGVPAPLTLQRLLDTNQATAVVPGVLYFATTGECLSCSSSTAASCSKESTLKQKPACASDAAAPTAVIADALRNFFLKENPWVEGNFSANTGAAARSSIAIPATSAAIRTDAIFVAPRSIPPYVYRPFFAEFGPLDLGCCVHFARRVRELLRAAGHVDLAAASGTSTQGKGIPAGLYSTRNTSAGDIQDNSTHSSNKGTGRIPSPRPHGIPSSSPPQAAAAAGSGNTPSSSVPSFASSCTPRTLPVVICASLNAQERVNMACLLGAFCVLVLGWSTAATWSRVFADVYPGFLTYRDASTGVSNYPLTLQDVWSGLERAVQLGWVAVDSFDLAAYWDGKEKDFSWIVPRRFVAMSSPQDTEPQRTAEVFARRLRAMNVRLVVRLNDNLYNPAPLLRLGIRHVDLPYADGSTPNDATLLRFLQAVEEHFGETVVPSSLRQWWSVSTVAAGGAAAGSVTRTAKHGQPSSSSRAASAGTSTSRSSGSCYKGKGAKPPPPRYAACSSLHSGKYRGMPDTRTVVPRRTTSASTHTSSFLPAAGEPGAVAVHCLAGLGRTGTMIAVYVMRHYGFTARDVLGWMRLCRPGSITGVQQQYLDTLERRLRPSPYVFAAQKLRDLVQTLQQQASRSAAEAATAARSRASSTASAVAAALSDADSPYSATAAAAAELSLDLARPPPAMRRTGSEHALARGLPRAEPALLKEQLWTTAAFQTHGNVVGDARPLTRQDSGLTQDRDGGQWGEGAWRGGGPPGLLLRVSSPQQQQHRRSSTSSTLSFSTSHQSNTALDAVSSMPVLGATAANERFRDMDNTGHLPAAAFTSGLFNDNLASSTLNDATVPALPRAGDYKYASTYFVALERANRRSSPRGVTNTTSAATNNTNSRGNSSSNRIGASAGTPARVSCPTRGQTATGAGIRSAVAAVTGTPTMRAATANTTFGGRHNRLAILQQQQQQQQHCLASSQSKCISTGNAGGPDPLGCDHCRSRNLSLSTQQPSSVTSMTSCNSCGGGGGGGGRWSGSGGATATDGSATMSGKWSANDVETPRRQQQQQRRYCCPTTVVNALVLGTPEPPHDGHAPRPRKSPHKPDRDGPRGRRHPLLRSSSSSSKVSTSSKDKEDAEGKPAHALAHVEAEGMHTQGSTLARLSPVVPPVVLPLRGMTDGSVKSLSPRSATIPETVLPLWGRPVGCV